MVGNEDEAIAVVNANRQRARSVALQFLTARAGKPANDREIFSGVELIEPLANLPAPLLAEAPPQKLIVVAEIAKGRIAE